MCLHSANDPSITSLVIPLDHQSYLSVIRFVYASRLLSRSSFAYHSVLFLLSWRTAVWSHCWSPVMSYSAKVVQHSINQLLINTINDAEKVQTFLVNQIQKCQLRAQLGSFQVLQNLPRDGDRVEVITSSSHDFSTTRRRYPDSRPMKTTYDVVADKVLRTPSQRSDERTATKSEVTSSTKVRIM